MLSIQKALKVWCVGREFFWPGLESLLYPKIKINIAPEYGTCGIFPIDEETIKYLNQPEGKDCYL